VPPDKTDTDLKKMPGSQGRECSQHGSRVSGRDEVEWRI